MRSPLPVIGAIVTFIGAVLWIVAAIVYPGFDGRDLSGILVLAAGLAMLYMASRRR